MDALLLDQMLPEYEERRQEAANYVPPPKQIAPSYSEEKYEAELGGLSTVPVVEEVAIETARDCAEKILSNPSSSSLQNNNGSIENASIYHPSATSPTINYEREYPQQKLVAVFGRQFDLPGEIASSLQKLVSVGISGSPSVKFVPFTMKRKALLKGSYDSVELLRHDLVCMCYNASEARILLTGVDGFYTSLLRHTEATLGPNKVTFLITNYRQEFSTARDNPLIIPSLKARLNSQEALRLYLDNEQVLSWSDTPSMLHAERLTQLAALERNPKGIFSNQSCVCL